MSTYHPSNVFMSHPEATRDLCYSSLRHDETERSHWQFSIPTVGREYPGPPPNGNLRVIVPDVDKDEVRRSLSPFLTVDTNTRTVFHTDRVYETHDTIQDKVASPKFRCSALRQGGHKAMCDMVPTDPRQQHPHPPTSPGLGPGCYLGHPLDDTALLPGTLDTSHKTLPLHKDTSRPSVAFRSPERDRTMQQINQEKRAGCQPCYFLPPDYSSWTRRGRSMPHGSRVIQAERWGHSLRQPRPPPEELSQSMGDLQVTKTCQPATTAAYIQDPNTPTYHTAFRSDMPRTMARHAHRKQDTRLRVKSFDKVTGAGTNLGPGSFDHRLPVIQSFHAAYIPNDDDQLRTVFSPRSPTRGSAASSPKRGSSHKGWESSSNLPSPTQPGRAWGIGSQPQSPTRHGSQSPTLPGHMCVALSAPLLSPQSHGPAPWQEQREGTQAGGTPGSSAAGSPLRSTSPTALSPGAASTCSTAAAAGAHATLLGDLVQPVASTQALPTIAKPGAVPATSLVAQVDEALQQDWAVHQLVVHAAYASTDDLRGAATLATRVLASAPTSMGGWLSPSAQSPMAGQNSSSLGVTSLSASDLDTREPVGPALRSDADEPMGASYPASSIRTAYDDAAAASTPESPTFRLLKGGGDPSVWDAPEGLRIVVSTRLPGDSGLSFLRRVVPHKDLVKQQLRAVKDVRAARRQAKAG